LSFKLKNLKKLENNKVLLELEISNSYLKKSLNVTYKDISQKAKIPGFRPGKVPYNVIDANYGREYVLNEAATTSISDLYPKIIDDLKIMPIDYPKVKIVNVGEDVPLDVEVTVEVEPEISAPVYKGIEATGISEEVTDEDVQKQIDNLRNNYAALEAVEEDKAVQKGDYVIIDFEGRIDGKEFEGNSAQDYTLEVGSGTLFEGFEEGLISMKKGENKKITVKMPEQIPDKEIAGKEAVFSIDLKEIKRKSLPELDEAFLKNFGEYKDLEEFKSFMSDRISEQKKKMRRDRIISDIINSLVGSLKLDVPEPMIANRIEHFNEDLKKELDEHKISKSDYLKAYNLTEESFNSNLRQTAIKETKEYLVINALEKSESEKIEPSQSQIAQEKEKILAGNVKESEKNKLKSYLDSEAGKESVKDSIKRRNLFDLLIKNAKINEESSKTTKKPAKESGAPGKSKEAEGLDNQKSGEDKEVKVSRSGIKKESKVSKDEDNK
jgi:trigger factor